ncbi:hypothetical protein MPER_15798, partial [Moniliophthora perniciosa FA553]
MAFNAMVVNNASGVELSYLDSGAPSHSPYTTIFAVHGMIFTSAIFSKVIDIAASNDIRF